MHRVAQVGQHGPDNGQTCLSCRIKVRGGCRAAAAHPSPELLYYLRACDNKGQAVFLAPAIMTLVTLLSRLLAVLSLCSPHCCLMFHLLQSKGGVYRVGVAAARGWIVPALLNYIGSDTGVYPNRYAHSLL